MRRLNVQCVISMTLFFGRYQTLEILATSRVSSSSLSSRDFGCAWLVDGSTSGTVTGISTASCGASFMSDVGTLAVPLDAGGTVTLAVPAVLLDADGTVFGPAIPPDTDGIVFAPAVLVDANGTVFAKVTSADANGIVFAQAVLVDGNGTVFTTTVPADANGTVLSTAMVADDAVVFSLVDADDIVAVVALACSCLPVLYDANKATDV